jgi:pyruvate dehydrogenase E2 component (dihydrolipoamide acetyltransferase)
MELPMKMPDLATTDSAIKVIRWLVEPGQAVKRGQPLLEIETDKAALEVESVATGVLKEVRARPADLVSVGEVIAVFEVAGASPSSDQGGLQTSALPATTLQSAAALPPAPSQGTGMFARNRATAAQRGTTPKPIPRLSAAQRVVGKRMQASKQSIPHFYLQSSANAEPMIVRRTADAPKKLAWDAFFVRAVGNALKQFPRMGWRMEADQLVATESDVVGVAVDIGGELYVLAIAAPSSKSPEQISNEIRSGVQRIQAGVLDDRALRSTSMTLTNLGGSNIESFSAIINPPEAAALAIGKIAPVAVVQEGQVVVQSRVSLTLSVDHRVANGKYAAEFLRAIVREVEAF